MKKLFTVQIRLDIEDLKLLDRLVKHKRYGSSRSEVLRRCLYETHAHIKKHDNSNDKERLS